MSCMFAFTVKHDSDFYKQYFAAKDEKEKFRQLAITFAEKHGIDGDIYVSKLLAVKPPKGKRRSFVDQTMVKPDRNGFYWFKKNSAIRKLWDNEVVPFVNWKLIDKLDFWWLGHIQCGSYSLWDGDGEIYGYLKDKAQKEIVPSEYMEPIKMSEYYAAIEQSQEGGIT